MDKFSKDFTAEEMVTYIKRTPKQYTNELPAKLEEWTKQQTLKAAYNSELAPVVKGEDDKIRQEIATKILVRHAPAATINPESLADYCVEAADELIKRLKR